MLPIVALGLLVSCENKENPKEPTGEYDGTEVMVIETVPSASSYFETGKEHKITLTTSAISRLSGIYIRDFHRFGYACKLWLSIWPERGCRSNWRPLGIR